MCRCHRRPATSPRRHCPGLHWTGLDWTGLTDWAGRTPHSASMDAPRPAAAARWSTAGAFSPSRAQPSSRNHSSSDSTSTTRAHLLLFAIATPAAPEVAHSPLQQPQPLAKVRRALPLCKTLALSLVPSPHLVPPGPAVSRSLPRHPHPLSARPLASDRNANPVTCLEGTVSRASFPPPPASLLSCPFLGSLHSMHQNLTLDPGLR
ncbi:uncharacterized protein B0I36DRAFT_151055 [Microdochium trichocladiopsis]|uniref:Uncharacterized protein n=1 Tax=Microdochium trichocladiopsis TaxID=1682393 RepID=A0A9P8Y0R7_9PEZI|nr:uncharacterized protein B0I36DRAFT_151055 [Microdochium trichocladiopsis]KAH7025921.1 hypothetical protein B0I36DRAFT_151055 [Microdochium trichocladiopsis]